MFDASEPYRSVGRELDPLPSLTPAARCQLAFQRLRKLLLGYQPGMTLDFAELRHLLEGEPEEAGLRIRWNVAQGWLCWFEGNWERAESLLHIAVNLADPSDGDTVPLATYWLARVRLLLHIPTALADYEQALRRSSGTPQNSVWYVDLLWRAGRIERAAQVWATLRGNKRVALCPESPLLEAKLALHLEDRIAAETSLREAQPTSGVVESERWLLLAWIAADQGQAGLACTALEQANRGVYPACVLAEWRRKVEARLQHRAVSRFREREISPEEFLSLLDDGAAPHDSATQAYVFLAKAVCERRVLDELENAGHSPSVRRNLLRLGLGQLDDVDLLVHSLEQAPPELQTALATQIVRLELQRRDTSSLDRCHGVLDANLLREVTLLIQTDSTGEATHALLRSCKDRHARGCLQAIALIQAIQTNQVDRVAENLGDHASWSGLESGPPQFVLRALIDFAHLRAGQSIWSRILPDWLSLWPAGLPGETGLLLASLAELEGSEPVTAPVGVDPAAWHAHQAALALLRNAPQRASLHLERVTDVDSVHDTVSRLVEAHHLAGAVQHPSPEALLDLVDLLREYAPGNSLLNATAEEVVERLARLEEEIDLPHRLLRHLALVETRLFEQFGTHHPLLATMHARRAWRCWMSYFATPEPGEVVWPLLIDYLLARHAESVTDHLGRDEIEPARSHWKLVLTLPEMARNRVPGLAKQVEAASERFRQTLTSDYLSSTRNAMRYADIPEGWRADYPSGLALLERLLNLDPDNLRVLTALIETCHHWFLDLYHLGHSRLYEEIERYTPQAEHLAELVAETGPLAARSALAEFWKFRGYASQGHHETLAFYRQALRFDPGNSNVRELLAELEGGA